MDKKLHYFFIHLLTLKIFIMKKSFNLLILVLTIGLFPVEIFAWQGMPTPMLHVEGRNLKDPSGNNVVLRGGWMQPDETWFNGEGRWYSNPSDWTNPNDVAGVLNYLCDAATLMSDISPRYGRNYGWYCTFVRMNTDHIGGWSQESGLYDINQFNGWINNFIVPYANHLRSRGLYFIISATGPINTPNNGSRNAGIEEQQRLRTFWSTLANAPGVKNANNIMFELMNEPVEIESSPGNGDWGMGSAPYHSALKNWIQPVINDIRNTGANNVIWVPCLGWQGEPFGWAQYPFTGSNIGIASHYYPAYGGCGDDVNCHNNLWDRNYKPATDRWPMLITENFWDINTGGLVTGSTANYGNTLKANIDAEGNVSYMIGFLGDILDNLNDALPYDCNLSSKQGAQAAFDWWYNYNGNSCNPTSITPYLQVNDGSWQQTSSVTVNSGDKIMFGPQPTSGGSWSWSGCGTSGSSREQTIYPTGSCTATAIYTNSCGATSSQSFNISVNGGSSGGTFDGVYSFIAQHSGKAIDVAGGGTSNGTNVQQWAYSGSNVNERFQITPTDNGYYRISPVVATSQAIDVDGISTADGANIHTWAYGGGNNQQWKFEDQGGGYYKIIARHSDKCLDVSDISTADGANLHQWTCIAGAQNQAFEVISVNSATTEISMKEVDIFPNPAVNGEFTVNIAGNGNKMYTMTIYSYDGKKVFEDNNLSSGTHKISTGLSKGIYFVKTNDSNDTIQKLIIE